MNKDQIGNLTTILKILIMTLGPSLAVYLEVTPDVVITFLTACLTFSLACLDAKYPNTFGWLGNNKPVLETEETVLNPEYECDEDGC